MAIPELVFDFVRGAAGPPERLRFVRPLALHVATRHGEVRDVVLAAEAAWREGAWVAGFLSYEAAPAFDPALQTRPAGALPLAWFAVFAAPAGAGQGDQRGGDQGDARPSDGREAHRTDAPAIGPWVPEWDVQAHAAAVARVRGAIAAGETYQLNLTHRLRAPFAGDGRGAWEALGAAQTAGYGAWLDLGRFQVASASPELFFDWDGARIVTRPMKGTAPRGTDAASDRAAAHSLRHSAKERAENAMIVDLLRNDLGRIAQPGSVEVEQLFALERYPTVWQLTSTVAARTRAGTGLFDVLAALFPCGSITGAPKVQTMRHIAALERSARGLYCGTIGLLSPDGRATFNVAIRTLVIDRERQLAEYGTGGGITWDSRAGDEWREAEAKAQVLSRRAPDFDLLETLRLEDGVYPREAEHLSRLLHSAEVLGFSLSGAEVEAIGEVLATVAAQRPVGTFMVRLVVSPPGPGTPADGGARGAGEGDSGRPTPHGTHAGGDSMVRLGRARATRSALPSTPVRPRVALHRVPLQLPHAAHKTSRREPYDRARAEHPGAWDVLLTNARGELTEFTRGNLIVELEDGRALTPPVDAGLLPGTMRARLLAEGRIDEQALTEAVLTKARRVCFVNDLRGVVEVELVGLPEEASAQG